MRRPLWHLLTVAMLLQLILVFTADTTPVKALHAVSGLGLALAALMTRRPRTRRRYRRLFRPLRRKFRRRG